MDPRLPADAGRLSTWKPYSQGLCEGCEALCCTLPVEATAADVVRLGWAADDECQGSLKKLAKRLIQEGRVKAFRGATGLFTLAQRPNGDCLFLGPDRRCVVYETRPAVCRDFPRIGPKPGFCPARKKR